jgi:predicted enzyme related to lactoylglutathione lyase
MVNAELSTRGGAAMTRPTGAPCWIDLMTSDAGRVTPFYTEL